MLRLSNEERANRLAVRHHLAPSNRAANSQVAARSLVGLHASDPASIYLAAYARVDGFTITALERATYDERTLVKLMGMRRTMFLLPHDLVAVVQAACSNEVAATMRRRLVKDIDAGGLTSNATAWLASVFDETSAHLHEAGPTTGVALSKAVPRLREKLTYAPGKTYGGEVSLTTRVLTLMAIEGVLVRGRPNGAWTSSQHRWCLGEPIEPIPPARAQATLVRAWLRSFGPATIADVVWWTGLGLGTVKRAIAAVGAVEVELHDGPGLVLGDDLELTIVPDPWCALLPSLDPTTMGWKQRAWYLGTHASRLFDRNGNAGPTIWWNGRIVGGWAVRRDGEVRHQLLDDIGADGRRAVQTEVERLRQWLDGTLVTPRFPVPLDRELRA